MLDGLFYPRSVAIIGASNNHRKFGNKAVRAYQHNGWDVYPVNPHESTIEGLTAYKSIVDVPSPIDRVSLYRKLMRTQIKDD